MTSELEEKLGHHFGDPALLAAALTHSSVIKAVNNERLEFLGDRVLSLVMAEALYALYPAEKEGDLAKRHAVLVAKPSLQKVAETLGLDRHMRLSAGESKSGGSKKDTILADAVEALIGALYLDGGFAAAQQFVRRGWQGMLDSAGAPPEDSKSRLQVWAQQRGLPLPDYKLVSRSGPDHAPVFEIEVSLPGHGKVAATAPSKQAAEKDAAARMMRQIEEKKP